VNAVDDTPAAARQQQLAVPNDDVDAEAEADDSPADYVDCVSEPADATKNVTADLPVVSVTTAKVVIPPSSDVPVLKDPVVTSLPTSQVNDVTTETAALAATPRLRSQSVREGGGKRQTTLTERIMKPAGASKAAGKTDRKESKDSQAKGNSR